MTTTADYTNLTEKNKQHVLILDDDVSVVKAMNRLLLRKRVHWEYSFASHVDEALEIIQNKKIDLIISDVKMPGKDGFHMLKSVRESEYYHDIPIILFTAFSHPRLKTKALEFGAVDLITKPINPDEMLARVHAVLKQQHQQEELKRQVRMFQEQTKVHSQQIWTSKIEIILKLAKALQFRNKEDSGHVVRIGYYSKILSDQLNLSKKYSEEIFIASPLHDIGKIAIPDCILLKTDAFTDKDRAIMNCHCQLGYDILKPHKGGYESEDMDLNKMVEVIFDLYGSSENSFLDLAAEIALSHHEWFNGNGYPYGLKGDKIPLPARIVSIVDVYDALRSQRVYKPVYSHEESLGIMRNNVSTQFDPEIFSAFEDCADEFNRISQLDYGVS